MRIEIKGLLAAVIAGAAVVGGAYGLSALVAGAHSTEAAHQGSAPPRSAPVAPPINAALVAQGQGFYTQSCVSCHGVGGAGGYGPSLRHEDMTYARIALTIKNGVKGKTPTFGGKHSGQQTQALVAYVRSLK